MMWKGRGPKPLLWNYHPKSTEIKENQINLGQETLRYQTKIAKKIKLEYVKFCIPTKTVCKLFLQARLLENLKTG